jgi:hypothetical protein
MKLAELNALARKSGFDQRRIQRIHSSLYRLSSGIPEQNTPTYFSSKWSALYSVFNGLESAYVVGYTKHFCFGSWQTVPVFSY